MTLKFLVVLSPPSGYGTIRSMWWVRLSYRSLRGLAQGLHDATVLAPVAIEQRRAVPDAAYLVHPERFVCKPAKPLPSPTEVWINKPRPSANEVSKATKIEPVNILTHSRRTPLRNVSDEVWRNGQRDHSH
jgi:hypothetical protein